MSTDMYVYLHRCIPDMYLFLYLCICLYMYIRICNYTCICICICICVWHCICLYVLWAMLGHVALTRVWLASCAIGTPEAASPSTWTRPLCPLQACTDSFVCTSTWLCLQHALMLTKSIACAVAYASRTQTAVIVPKSRTHVRQKR